MGLLVRADDRGTGLRGRRALVVGGSGGIGRAVSYSLAHQGAAVVVHGGTNAPRLEQVVQYINSHGGAARQLLHRIDVATDILPALETIGDIDILVVSFGPVLYAPLERTTAEDWMRITDLNLTLPALLLQRFLPEMRRRRWGRVVLFGGPRRVEHQGFREVPAYGAAKAGVVSLCRSVAATVGDVNISVNVVAPGYVDTEYLTDAERQRARSRAPRGALIPPERVARVVRDLVCAEEPDIHGAVIPVDQGMV